MIDQLLDALRAAAGTDATPEARNAGAAACRAILAQLEPPVAPVPKVALDPAAIAQAVAALRGVPPDQLLDLAIAKLRAALPAGTEIAPVKGFNFSFLPGRS